MVKYAVLVIMVTGVASACCVLLLISVADLVDWCLPGLWCGLGWLLLDFGRLVLRVVGFVG